jgi:exodeoxyribonuclease VIII
MSQATAETTETATTIPDKPGIYENVPFDEYAAWPFVNNSSLSALRRSPAHYKASQSTEWDTDALRFGRFLHDSLDPSVVAKHYAFEPDLTVGIDAKVPRATNEYRRRRAEFEKLVDGKEIVSQQWFEATQRMLQQLNRNDLARQWITQPGPAEASIVWEEPQTGMLCKARMDKWCRELGVIADVKTAGDLFDFNRSIGRYRYHRQAAFYVDAVRCVAGERCDFGFIAVEKSEPYSVLAATLDDDSVVEGRIEYRRLLKILKRCTDNDDWPGPPNPVRWRCPEWAIDFVCNNREEPPSES